jgi:FkbM family methyltransferase
MLNRVASIFVARTKGICWRILSPTVQLDSGIQLIIQGHSDWDVFSEIFVNREYDTAILDALSLSPADSPIWILDLGANVGYFSLRVLHLARLVRVDGRLRIRAFEGNPKTFEILVANLASASGCDIEPHLGLIGRREGRAHIYAAPYSGVNSVVSNSGVRSKLSWRGAYALPSSYIDVQTVVPRCTTIDLLKCDIEGSEAEFLLSYSDLLRDTKRLIIEFHPRYVNVAKCHDIIRSAGLVHVSTLRQHETMVLSYFGRP